jgi:uncharacterized membrane protein
MGVDHKELPAIIEKFGGDRTALVKFVYETDTHSGGLAELSGELEKDVKKISSFFDGYDMHIDESVIRKIGAGIYEGAAKQKKKQGKSLSSIFLNMIKEFDQATTQDFRR